GLGHRHRDRGVGQLVGEGVGGVVHGAAGRLHQQQGLRQLVLHRLEGADAAAELLALLHVGDRLVEQRRGDADQDGRGGGGGVVEGPVGGFAAARQAGVVTGLRRGHLEEPAGAVPAAQRGQGQPVLGERVQLAVTLENDQVGGGVGDERGGGQADAG